MSRHDDYNRLNRRLTKQFKGKRSFVQIEVMSPRDALQDERIGECMIDYLYQCFQTAVGLTDDRLQCFVCCQTWSDTRIPTAFMVVEFLGLKPKEGEAQWLLTSICNECADKSFQHVRDAIRRDFPQIDELWVVGEEGHA